MLPSTPAPAGHCGKAGSWPCPGRLLAESPMFPSLLEHLLAAVWILLTAPRSPFPFFLRPHSHTGPPHAPSGTRSPDPSFPCLPTAPSPTHLELCPPWQWLAPPQHRSLPLLGAFANAATSAGTCASVRQPAIAEPLRAPRHPPHPLPCSVSGTIEFSPTAWKPSLQPARANCQPPAGLQHRGQRRAPWGGAALRARCVPAASRTQG